MLYTLRDLKDLVAPYVLTGGSCPDAVTVRNRINEAIRRLLSEGRADWTQTLRKVRLSVSNGLVTLPREFETARLVNINRSNADLLPMNYQYLDSGPGPEDAGEHYGNDLVDEGDGWPTFFDIPRCETSPDYFLFAASPVFADRDKKVLIFGRDKAGNELLQESGMPGMELDLGFWTNGVEGSLSGLPAPLSPRTVASISAIKLPDGRKGYVSLYAVNPQNHAMFFLGKYHPDETRPGYRRYRILSNSMEAPVSVDMLCKVRYLPATRDDDVLLIQNPDALKTMVMAIREENAGNLQASVLLEEKANGQLLRQNTNHRSGDPIIDVRENFGMGSIPSII